MQSKATYEIAFTNHALARIRQRGVRSAALALVLAEADEQHHVGGGAVAERISREKRDQLRRYGVSTSALDAARDLVVVFAQNGAVMTVIAHTDHRGRNYRGADRTSPRRRTASRKRR